MKTRSASKPILAFTVVEVLIVVAVIVLFCTIILPSRPHHHMTATISGCINNLRQIDMAFNVFAIEHSDRFPWQCSITNSGTLELIGNESPAPHFQTISNYVSSYNVLVALPTRAGKRSRILHRLATETSVILSARMRIWKVRT